jgi:hypothetical protein
LFFTLILFSFQLPTHAQTPTAGPRKFDRIQEVVENWQADQHLYVKGNVGVSAGQLKSLEAWLDENGSNWTIVLMESASGQSFTTNAEGSYRGREAVYYALGHGLSNQTNFGNQLHPKTNEPHGAIFVLFRKERKFNYFGSDAQDRRGLGESKWFGTLDREAIRAMRNGRRVNDAVKNTVNMINGRLESSIAAAERRERKAKAAAELAIKRARAQRIQQIDSLKARVDETRNSLIQRAVSGSSFVKQNYPEAANSKLANPPANEWQGVLDSITKYLDTPKLIDDTNLLKSKQFPQQNNNFKETREQIDRHLDALAAHRAFEEMLAPVETRLDAAMTHSSRIGVQAAEQGYDLLNLARQEHAQGNPSFTDQITQAETLAATGQRLIDSHLQAEQEKAQRRSLIQRTVAWALGGIGALLAGVLTLLNYRRRHFLNQAHASFDQRQKQVDQYSAAVTELNERSESIIGSYDSFGVRGFKGHTKTLGESTLQSVDRLNQMASEARDTIESAHNLLSPPSVLGQAANMISSRRYQQCYSLLESRSLQLPPLPTTDDTVAVTGWVDFETFFENMSFNSTTAHQHLDTFDASLKNVGPELRQLNDNIDEISAKEKTLSQLARRDRYFKTPALFEALIPSIQADYEQASRLAKSDPLQATTVVLPVAVRKSKNASDVIATIETARETVFPMLEKASKGLKDLRYDIRWIEKQAQQLSKPADQLFQDAVLQDVQPAANEFKQRVHKLGLRAKRTLELAQELANDVAPQLEQLTEKVKRDRRHIADTLKIDAAQSLHETDLNPDLNLANAQEQYRSARAAVAYGGVESILESLDAIEDQTTTATNLADASLQALQDYQPDRDDRITTLARLRGLVGPRQNEIQTRQQIYSDSAFAMRPRFEDIFETINSQTTGSDEASTPTLDLAIEFCQRTIETCQNSIDTAAIDHAAGRVLNGARLLELAKLDLGDVEQTLDAVEQQCGLLDQQNSDNEQHLPIANQTLSRLQTTGEDHRVQRPTKADLSSLVREFDDFGQRFASSSEKRAPFVQADLLKNFDRTIEQLTAATQADFQAFDEASRAIVGAEKELQTAIALTQQASNDGIPDSRVIDACRAEVEKSEAEITAIRAALATPHGDWKSVDDSATAVNARLAVTIGELRRQLQLAQQAASELESAARSVFDAANWRGRYGITIDGRPGSNQLEDARSSLTEGEYTRCINFSRSAGHESQQAMEDAQNRVNAERRRRERAAEAERRRQRQQRMRSSSSSSFGSSSFGSSSSSSSSFGGSSSSGSSGFGSESGW